MATVVLTEAVLDLVTHRLQVLSDPVRMRTLLALQDGECSVQELADVLDLEQCRASRSLSALHREGLLTRRQNGARVLYAVADYTAYRLIDQVAESVTAHIEELHDLVVKGD